MQCLLCLLFLLLVLPVAQAETVISISWVPPTVRVTGAAMADSEISHYDVFCWPDGKPEDSQFLGTVENTGHTNNATLADHILKWTGTCTLAGCDFHPRALVVGLNWCAVSVVDVKGLASDFSGPVAYTIPPWPARPVELSD